MMESKNHVVILGAGFAGIYTLKHLRKYLSDAEVEITVINNTDHFLFTPLLLEVASGSMPPAMVVEDLQETFGEYMDNFLQAEVNSIDLNRREVSTNKGEVPFDYLVIALGSKTNYYNTQGAEENTLPLKGLQDAIRIRDRIITNFRLAAETEDSELKQRLLSFTVVGAGPSGVDLAIEIARYSNFFVHRYEDKNLAKYVKINLVDMMPEPLPSFPERYQKISKQALLRNGIKLYLGQKVASVKEGKITLASGDDIASETIIWLAGVISQPPQLTPQPELDKRNTLVVNQYLQLTSDPEVFAVGDIASSLDPKTRKPLAMLAQVAVKQAPVVAYNIAQMIRHPLPLDQKLKSLNYKSKGFLIPLGQWDGAGEIYGVPLSGFIAWMMRRAIYIVESLSWRQRWHLITTWFKRSYSGRYMEIMK